MSENKQRPQLGEVLRRMRGTIPPARFWGIILGSLATGVVIAMPIAALVMFHEGPWTGFLWDVLVRLPFLLFVFVPLVGFLKSIRERKFKEGMNSLLGLIFFGSLTALLVWFAFVQHVQLVIHFHRIQPDQVLEVRLGCNATADPGAVQQILSDLRKAEWYSPDSHGWSAYADLTLRFADGHSERYSLTEVLAEGRLVVRWPGSTGVLVAVPNLANSMQRAGLLRVAAYPRYDHKGHYQAIVPSSVCKPEQARNN